MPKDFNRDEVFVYKWMIDLRNVIGLFFIIVGIILIMVAMSPLHKIVQELDIQLWCGIISTVFGAIMVASGSLIKS